MQAITVYQVVETILVWGREIVLLGTTRSSVAIEEQQRVEYGMGQPCRVVTKRVY